VKEKRKGDSMQLWTMYWNWDETVRKHRAKIKKCRL